MDNIYKINNIPGKFRVSGIFKENSRANFREFAHH